VGKLTSTQAPQVMPSIRSSHLSVSPGDFPKGSFSMSGSSTLPEPGERGPLYQKVEENVAERADIDVYN
jgi:hypothetical protein